MELKYLDVAKPTLWFFEWRDHTVHSSIGWVDSEDYLTPSTILSIGWVLSEDEESIYIASHLCPDDGIHQGEFCIIKSCIVNAVAMETPNHAVHFPTEASRD